jgi:hypothetical protein
MVAPDAVIADEEVPETMRGATSESVAVLDELFKVAVTAAVWSAVKAFAAATKVPLVEPEGIVSEAGTVTFAELELKPMVPPPDPARIRVQVLDAPGARVPGVQTMELIGLTAPATLTVPPVAVTAVESPAAAAPTELVIVSGASLLPERATETVATTPSEMVLEFIPHATHVYELAPLTQDRVLPAETSAGPPAKVKLPTLVEG